MIDLCTSLFAQAYNNAVANLRLLGACSKLSADSVDRIVCIVRNTSVDSDRCCRALLHLFQHQIHHRGQVHAMLSGTRSSPPQLDEFFPDSPNERRLRAADLAVMGLSETAI